MTAPRKILIVEDNELQKTLYVALSSRFNFSLEVVKNCREAVAFLKEKNDFQMVIMDLGLSDVNGCDCAKTIREIEKTLDKRVPIVAVTGHTSDEYKQDCFDAGMDDFLSKPFSMEQFKTTIDKWCDET